MKELTQRNERVIRELKSIQDSYTEHIKPYMNYLEETNNPVCKSSVLTYIENLDGSLSASTYNLRVYAIKNRIRYLMENKPDLRIGEQYVVERFLNDLPDECCLFQPMVKVKSSQLYETYKNWCEKEGDQILSQREFSIKLLERGFEKKRCGSGNFWECIRLNNDTYCMVF